MGLSAVIVGSAWYSMEYLYKKPIESQESKLDNKEVADTKPKPKGTVKAELLVYPFEEGVKEADLIAEVQITKKIEEINEPSPKTLFEATAIENYKSPNNKKTIQILQQGNSEWTYEDNPLFQENDKYILFLKKYIGDEYDSKDTYWILGAQTNTYSILSDNEVMKNAYYDEELSSIEKTGEIENSEEIIESKMKNLTNISIDESAKLNENDLKEADIQVFNKDTFVNKINNTINLTEK